MPKQIWCCSECKHERVYGDAPVEDKDAIVYLLCEGKCDKVVSHTYDRTDYGYTNMRSKGNEEVR